MPYISEILHISILYLNFLQLTHVLLSVYNGKGHSFDLVQL